MKVIRKYNDLLIKYPKTVSTISSAFIASFGDLGAQTLEHFQRKKLNKNVKFKVDWYRNMKVFSYGLIFTGVPVHYWYVMCDKIPYLNQGAKYSVITKKVILTNISMSPILTGCFFAYSHFLDHFGNFELMYKSLMDELRLKFYGVYINSLRLWVPTNFLVFGVVPGQWKVVFANSVATIWYFYLSYVKFNEEKNAILEAAPDVD